MTFYAANNYLGQTPVSQSSSKDIQSSPLIRKPQPIIRISNVPRKGINRINAPNYDKFVPSVQYDPQKLGSDTEYFMPVRYSSKAGHEDHVQPQVYQEQKVTYSDLTATPSPIARKENRYYANVRPVRPYTTNGRDQLPRKQAKPILGSIRDDYLLDYSLRPANTRVNYPIKDLQGHRHLPVYSNLQPLDPVAAKQPLLPQPPRNPHVNLDQILESFHLSERLPEMLSKDNIDNSLRTLAEILNILHSTKKGEYPQQPSLTQLITPRLPQKLPNGKTRPQRPKVITETRFQATPNPLYLTADPERYMGTYEDEIGQPPEPPSGPAFNTDSVNNNKVVEYYIPVVQSIPEKQKEVFLPTIRPQVDTTEHSYQITEDLNEDVLQQGRFTPTTTESPVYGYTEPNDVSTPQVSVPQTSIKYGATRGEANVDYPAYSIIPVTKFSCKEQRYKGFFGDPETGCQVQFSIINFKFG